MVVQPKVKGFMCTTAHPEGCKESVRRQIEYVKSQPKAEGPKKVLVLGASMGYGLASRIALTYACGADSIGVIFDKPGKEKRTASAGWYNTAAFEQFAQNDGHYAKSINGDAYSQEIKEETIALIKKDFGQVDMVIYSLAAPRRTTADNKTWSSTLKTTTGAFTEKSLDLRNNTIVTKTVEAANEEELEGTIKVMGGEDWMDWMDALTNAGVLSDNAVTVAYSYIGPELTYPIYTEGTIGQAKKHLTETAGRIQEKHPGVCAYISVNKALVTQASAAIPIVPLYFAILYKVMKEQGTHEGCIEQISRLFHDKLFQEEIPTDQQGRIRMDDWELAPQVQDAVMDCWKEVNTENVEQLSDIEGYWEDFYHMFGFHIDNVDYSRDVEIQVEIPSLAE